MFQLNCDRECISFSKMIRFGLLRPIDTEKYTVRYFPYRSHDFFQFAFEREISQFFALDYMINRTLHGGLKI